MPNPGQKGIAHILLLILIVAGIALGIYLVQNRTNIFPQAASGPIEPRTALSFLGTKNNYQLGEQFDIKVLVSSDFDAANTFKAKVVYRPDILQLVKITPGINESTQAGSFITKWIEQSESTHPTDSKYNVVTLVGSVPNPGFKTSPGSPGTMATLTFKGIKEAQTSLGYYFDESAIYRNSDNQNILQATDAWVTNIGPASSGIPSVDSDGDGFLDGDELFYGTDPKKACGINAWPPDLNDDTYINGGDVSFLVPYIDGTKPYAKRYDLNRDSKITQEGDVPVIQKYFLKSCSVAPVCTTSSAKTVKVDSSNQVTWTYAFADPTKITKVSFQATPGVTWKAAGLQGQPGAPLEVGLPGGVNPFVFSAIVSQACQAFTGNFTLTNSCGTPITSFVGMGSPAAWGQACQTPGPSSSPSPTPPPVDGRRADLYNDPKKPNFVNDQDISVFYSKCAEKGIELFGQPASVQPICDILEDGKITVSDWAVLIKFRNQSVQ